MKNTILRISALPCLDLKLHTREPKEPLNHSIIWTKGGHMDLDLTSRNCQGHPRPIMTPIKPLSCLLGVPLLILPGWHLLLVPLEIHIMPYQLLIRFTLMLSHSLSGMHLIKGGGPNITLLPLLCLHHLLNRNHRLLLHQGSPKFLPKHNPIHIHLKYTPPLSYPYHHFQTCPLE